MKTKSFLFHAYTILCAGFLLGTISSCEKPAEDKENLAEGKDKPTPGKVIDLGLSVKWASCNVGASAPEGYGGYYAWGETEEKGSYTFENYRFYNPQTDKFDVIGDISGTQYDVARVKWGGSWRMPTVQEQEELCNKCSWKWMTYNGINGQLVTGPNGNKIFLPTAGYREGTGLYDRYYGYYWLGSQYADGWNGTYFLNFDSDGWITWNSGYFSRHFGFSVRPVSEK